MQVCVCSICGRKVNAVECASLRRTCFNASDTGERVGHHLSLLLKKLSIRHSAGCKCKAKEKYLNNAGANWCEQNIETIVEWLKEEASARGLPFFSTIARMLVRRAIANARKEASRGKEVTTT
jgi:hypothetical protein